MWDIIEERKEEATEERKKIMESGWIETQMEALSFNIQRMMQVEVDKFKGSVQFIHDYYHAIEEKVIPEPPPTNVVNVAPGEGEGELPAVEGEGEAGVFPRIEKLYERAIKA